MTSKQRHYYSGILMGVQGTKKSEEAQHEIFMGIFVSFFFVPLFTPDHRRKNVSRPKVPVLEACRKGLPLAYWGVMGNALPSFPTRVGFFFPPSESIKFFFRKLEFHLFLSGIWDPNSGPQPRLSPWELE